MNNSISAARTAIDENFKHIRNEIEYTLECRKKAILNTISEIERRDLDPLSHVEGKINGELNKTVELIGKGELQLSLAYCWLKELRRLFHQHGWKLIMILNVYL